MEELNIFRGGHLFFKGRKHKDIMSIALAFDSIGDDNIEMSKAVRKILRIRLGDVIFVHSRNDVPYEKRIHITDDIFEKLLKLYFSEAYRPVRKGDVFPVLGALHPVAFKVVDVDPGEFVICAPETMIDCEDEPIKHEDDVIDYNDIGGCKIIMAQIEEAGLWLA